MGAARSPGEADEQAKSLHTHGSGDGLDVLRFVVDRHDHNNVVAFRRGNVVHERNSGRFPPGGGNIRRKPKRSDGARERRSSSRRPVRSGSAVSADLLAGIGELACLENQETVGADEFAFARFDDTLLIHCQFGSADCPHLSGFINHERLCGFILGEHLELFGLEFVEGLIFALPFVLDRFRIVCSVVIHVENFLDKFVLGDFLVGIRHVLGDIIIDEFFGGHRCNLLRPGSIHGHLCSGDGFVSFARLVSADRPGDKVGGLAQRAEKDDRWSLDGASSNLDLEVQQTPEELNGIRTGSDDLAIGFDEPVLRDLNIDRPTRRATNHRV